MKQSPQKGSSCSAGQEIVCFIRIQKFLYHIYIGLPLNPIFSWINPVHTSTTYFLKTHHNIILALTSKSPMGISSLQVSDQNLVCIPMHTTCPVHLILHDLLYPKICGTMKRQNVCIVIKSTNLTKVKKFC